MFSSIYIFFLLLIFRQIFGGGNSLDGYVKRIIDSDDEDDAPSLKTDFSKRKATEHLIDHVCINVLIMLICINF